MNIRSLLLVGVVLIAVPATAALAQSDRQLEEQRQVLEERQAIESRIETLTGEIERLQLELETLPLDEPPLLDPEVELVREEIAQRRQLERESSRNPLAITTHRRNYIFPISYNAKPNKEAFANISPDTGPRDAEVKFQFSAKVNLVEDLFGDTGDLYFAYTQRSWWQAYNTDASSPFRETNYEPEFFLNFDHAWSALGWTNVRNRLALNHLSNGRSEPLSRSWNRVYLESMFQRGDWGVSVAPFWRIPESKNDDDNRDISRYKGYGDITVARRLNGDQEASLMVRGNPSAGHMGGQLDYSWELFGNIRAHVQYYYGYGESMIDYDHRNHRLSLGFSLNPLFSGGSMTR